ncbi:unnamed protein product [Clavelina lepadiformis]|uniref:Uncharacterized protein n=1 Tax=Clavelina lepadiformis TaxID=159417 RepID=A0ABP0F7N0_CLALP
MKVGTRQIGVLLLLIFDQAWDSASQETSCKRNLSLLEEGRECRKPCQSNSDCKGVLKKCRCDNICGKSCYNPDGPCDELEPFENGVIDGLRTYGNEVTYSCNDGYVLVGSSTRTCRSDKKWTGSAPYCKSVCAFPARTSSAYPETDDSNFDIGDIVTYSCRFGFILSGNPTITCTVNGWTPNQFRCSKVDCKSPKDIQNGYWEGDDFLFGGRVYYHCNLGYELQQRQNYISCSTNGEWQGQVPVCEAKTCQAPIAPEHGSVDDRGIDYEYNNRITYSCESGYRLEGSEVGRCNENKNWGEVPTCVVDKDCDFEDFRRPICGFTTSGMKFNRTFIHTGANGRRGYIAKASFERSQRNAQAILSSPIISRNTQVCLRFYYRVSEFESGSEFYARMEGESRRFWAFNQFELRNIWLGAEYSFSSSRNDLEVHFTARSSRSSTTVELDDISFSENTRCGDECNPNPCRNQATCVNRINDYKCFCRSGFEGKDCSIETDCVVPRAPSFGSVRPASGKQVKPGGSIIYSCDQGYFMSNQPTGSLTAICLSNKNWDHTVPTCEEIHCTAPSLPEDGTSSETAGTKISIDESIVFGCNEGYTMIGQPTIFCSGAETWSSEIPECVERRCTSKGECHFPFKYGGKTYKTCPYYTSGGYYWCSLTPTYTDSFGVCDRACKTGWSEWSKWGECSEGCVKGHQTRSRICQNPTGGKPCEGQALETRECNIQSCLDRDGFRFEDKIYRLFKAEFTYNDAAARCARSQGRLAVLKTRSIFNEVVRQMPRRRYFHIGIRRLDGRWKFSDGSRVPLSGEGKFERWARGQPSYSYLYPCVILRTDTDTWDNYSCNKKRPFICEFDIPASLLPRMMDLADEDISSSNMSP